MSFVKLFYAGQLRYRVPVVRSCCEPGVGDTRSWPDGTVVGVRTDGIDGKQALLESFPHAFFTIAHFEGYPAVLVRLDTVDLDLLREVVTDAWLLRASKRAATEWLAANPPPSAPER